MRKVTLKLKSFGDHDNGYVFAKIPRDPLLCREVLSEFFTLPRKKSTSISFVISGKELPDSYKVKFDGRQVEIFDGDKWCGLITYLDARWLLEELKLTNKEFWVSLYWEE